jgi:large subunit ribosomal protein L3
MPLGLIGKKLGHTRVYDAYGILTPVTVVQAGPNRVLQVRSPETDGYRAVQLGFGDQKIQRLNKAQLGHLVRFGAVDAAEAQKAHQKAAKGTKPVINGVAKIREFRDFSKEVKPGEMINVDLFAPGDFVDCIGVTKGRGFEGVMKRHGFRGGDASHGAKGWRRRTGAIGQRLFPGTVMRGQRMPGHMGQVRRTTQNLEVIQVRKDDGLLLIKGAIPGSEGDYVIIRESKKIPKDSARAKAIHAARAKLFAPPGEDKKKGAAKAAKK